MTSKEQFNTFALSVSSVYTEPLYSCGWIDVEELALMKYLRVMRFKFVT